MTEALAKYVQPGRVVTAIAPVGGVVVGTPLLIGSIFGVARDTKNAGDAFPFYICEVWDIPKATGYTLTAMVTPVYWDETDKEANSDTGNPVVGIALEDAASGDTSVRVLFCNPKFVEAAAASARLDIVEADVSDLQDVNGLVFFDTNAGVGDQVNLTDTNAHAHTEKCSVPAAICVADDILIIDGAEWVDDQDSTPQITIEVKVGATVVDTIVIATAADNDWVTFHEEIKLTTVGASLVGEVTSSGFIKDGTVSARGDLQKALAITASSTAGFDVTVEVTSASGHADNKVTMRTLSIGLKRGTA